MSDDINVEELELTEDEMNRIFFGAGDDKVKIKEPVKDPVDHIKKNIVKKVINLKRKPKKETDDTGEKKRPQGRPRIWTPEKIAQKKEENKRKAKLARLKKQDALRIAQLSGDHPISKYEKDKRIDQVLKTREEIHDQVTTQRETLKNALDRKFVLILDQKSKCREHLYKISHYEEKSKDPIGVCVHCSKSKQFTPTEWKLYHSKNKDKL